MWRSHLEHESQCDRNHHQTSKPGCTGFILSWKRSHCTLYWIVRSWKKHGADSYIFDIPVRASRPSGHEKWEFITGSKMQRRMTATDSNHWTGKPCWMPNPLMLLLWPQTRKCGWKTKDELGDFKSSSCQYYDAFLKTGSDGRAGDSTKPGENQSPPLP